MLTSTMLAIACLQRQVINRKAVAKRSCSEVLATCKTLQSRVPPIRVIALNHPALAPGCLFIGLLSDVPGNPFNFLFGSTRLTANRLTSSSVISKHPLIAQATGVLFFGARKAAAGNRQVGNKGELSSNRSLKRSPLPYAGCTPSFFSVLPIADCLLRVTRTFPRRYPDFSTASRRPRARVTPDNFQ